MNNYENPYSQKNKMQNKCYIYLKELDLEEIYEWGHLKLLKVNSLIKKKKFEQSLIFLQEIAFGLDWAVSIPKNENIILKKRINEELRKPALKKLVKIYIDQNDEKKAIEICNKLIENEENTQDFIKLKEIIENSKLKFYHLTI